MDGYLPAGYVCIETCRRAIHGGTLERCDSTTLCTDRATEMKFKVTGLQCSESVNVQESKFWCVDFDTVLFPTFIKVTKAGNDDEVLPITILL